MAAARRRVGLLTRWTLACLWTSTLSDVYFIYNGKRGSMLFISADQRSFYVPVDFHINDLGIDLGIDLSDCNAMIDC